MKQSTFRVHSPGGAGSPSSGGLNGMTIDTATMDIRHSTSPDDQSLRGVPIAGSDEMMVLSADEEDEKSNG